MILNPLRIVRPAVCTLCQCCVCAPTIPGALHGLYFHIYFAPNEIMSKSPKVLTEAQDLKANPLRASFRDGLKETLKQAFIVLLFSVICVAASRRDLQIVASVFKTSVQYTTDLI